MSNALWILYDEKKYMERKFEKLKMIYEKI